MRAYHIKNAKLDDDNKLTMQEIADEIKASENLKDAYNRLGLSHSEVRAARIDYKKIRKGK